MRYYAGIGSRETPTHIGRTMKNIASFLNDKFILRSGGADGADSYFESGATNKEIYLPWKNFNNNLSPLFNVSQEAIDMASKYHPNWNNLKDSVKKVMGRNTYQILGIDLNTPVDFVVCYTSDGLDSGGTGQAIRLARDLKIPVYNLYSEISEYNFLSKILENEAT